MNTLTVPYQKPTFVPGESLPTHLANFPAKTLAAFQIPVKEMAKAIRELKSSAKVQGVGKRNRIERIDVSATGITLSIRDNHKQYSAGKESCEKYIPCYTGYHAHYPLPGEICLDSLQKLLRVIHLPTFSAELITKILYIPVFEDKLFWWCEKPKGFEPKEVFQLKVKTPNGSICIGI